MKRKKKKRIVNTGRGPSNGNKKNKVKKLIRLAKNRPEKKKSFWFWKR